jgi:nucleoside triphosphate diphosphatase
MPEMIDPRAPDIGPLVDIMQRLRDPESGCPWDVGQDFNSVAPYTIEEAYEVADACARDDMMALKDELGDLLLQVVFHARMAQERGAFALNDVIASICDKMVRRHPHVFGPDASQPDWEGIKADERNAGDDTSALAGVALALPALLRAEKLQKRAARTGFDWPDPTGPLTKIHEEIAEVQACATQDDTVAEIGDLLFAVVNWARHLKVDPEAALRSANAKFEHRFRGMEALAGNAFTTLDLDAKEQLWRQVKDRA